MHFAFAEHFILDSLYLLGDLSLPGWENLEDMRRIHLKNDLIAPNIQY